MSKLPIPVVVRADAQPDLAAEAGALAASASTHVEHARTAQRLTHKYAASMINNGALTLALTTRLWDPAVWGESAQLSAAVAQRLRSQGLDWRQGCTILLEDYGQLRQANTMSKLVEKQCNLTMQFGQLLSSQATNFLALLENIDVDYGYWASQKRGWPEA
nr:hypothetical protein [uncultured Duganella sp.]